MLKRSLSSLREILNPPRSQVAVWSAENSLGEFKRETQFVDKHVHYNLSVDGRWLSLIFSGRNKKPNWAKDATTLQYHAHVFRLWNLMGIATVIFLDEIWTKFVGQSSLWQERGKRGVLRQYAPPRRHVQNVISKKFVNLVFFLPFYGFLASCCGALLRLPRY